MSSRSLRRPCLALAAAILVQLTLMVGVGAAQSIPKLDGQITDQAGVVGNGRASLESALADLLARENVQLYALFVRTTSGEDPTTYAQATFEQNFLGGNDFLVVVAVDDRRFAWWDKDAVPSLPSSEIDSLLSKFAEPQFRAGDYAAGVAAFATGLADDLAAPVPPPATAPPNDGGSPAPQPSASLDTGLVVAIVGLILVIGGIVLLLAWVQRWRQSRLTAEERDRRTGQLARDANALLIQADDAVREADQELAFAEAEFEEPDVAPLRDALAKARDEMKAAFALRQQLDDATPEDPPTKERMLGEIVERSRRVMASLTEQRERVQKLRDAEQAAPQTLAGLPALIDAVAPRIPAAESALQQLHAYAEPTWKPVDGNVAEAEKRIAAARDAVAAGVAAFASTPPQPNVGAQSARRAERVLGEATALLDAIDRQVGAVSDARGRLDPELTAAQQDIASARAALNGKTADPALAQKIVDAERLLAQARQEAGTSAPDVIGALRDAQAAHQAADAILAGIRDAQAQQARQAAALASAIRTAEASVAGANDFIATRRQGVGREARTRLSTAQGHLDAAHQLVSSDPARALDEAGQADRAAAEAYRLAQSDFDQWDRPGPRGGDNVGAAILGGLILGNILGGMGGGRQGGGWGGTPWGMPGGGHGGGGSWGGLGNIGGGGGGRGGSGSW